MIQPQLAFMIHSSFLLMAPSRIRRCRHFFLQIQPRGSSIAIAKNKDLTPSPLFVLRVDAQTTYVLPILLPLFVKL
jgi:hypothetical protein